MVEYTYKGVTSKDIDIKLKQITNDLKKVDKANERDACRQFFLCPIYDPKEGNC